MTTRPGWRGTDIITEVATTDATVPDTQMTEPIHAALAGRDLLPAEHYLDSGYPSAALVVDSLHRWGVSLVTPTAGRPLPPGQGRRRVRPDRFTIDFDAQQATCPQGQPAARWNPVTQRGTDAIVIKFAAGTCRACPVRDQCTPRPPAVGRQFDRAPRDVHHAQLAARAAQDTPDWQARYARSRRRRSHHPPGCRSHRHAPRPLPRPAQDPLEHAYAAAALNLIRLHACWNGHPLDRTRTSHLSRLEHALAA